MNTIYYGKKNTSFKILSACIAVAFFFNTIGVDTGYALQAPLNLNDVTFRLAFHTKYAVDRARDAVDMLESGEHTQATGKPNSLQEICDVQAFLEEDLKDVAFEVHRDESGAITEVLITVRGDVILRYFDPEKAPKSPEGTVQAPGETGVYYRFHGHLARELLYTENLQVRLARETAGTSPASGSGSTKPPKKPAADGRIKGITRGGTLIAMVIALIMGIGVRAKLFAKEIGDQARNFSETKTTMLDLSYDFQPEGQMKSGARNIISGYNLINEGIDTVLTGVPYISDTRAGRAADILLLRLPLALYGGMVLHEYYGHGARAREYGLSSSYHISPMDIFDEGFYYTVNDEYSVPYSTEELTVITGGMSAGQVLADELRDTMFETASPYHSGLLYAAAKLNLTKYILLSSQPPSGEYYTDRSDIQKYWNRMEGRYDGDLGFSWHDMQILAVWNAIDPTVWYSLYGMACGEEMIELPSIWPYTGADLTPIGPEGYLGIHIRSDVIMEDAPFSSMRVAMRKGWGPEGDFYGVGLQLNRIPIADGLMMSRLGVHYFRQQEENGVAIEVGLEQRLTDALSLTFGWTHKDEGYVLGLPVDEGGYFNLGLRMELDRMKYRRTRTSERTIRHGHQKQEEHKPRVDAGKPKTGDWTKIGGVLAGVALLTSGCTPDGGGCSFIAAAIIVALLAMPYLWRFIRSRAGRISIDADEGRARGGKEGAGKGRQESGQWIKGLARSAVIIAELFAIIITLGVYVKLRGRHIMSAMPFWGNRDIPLRADNRPAQEKPGEISGIPGTLELPLFPGYEKLPAFMREALVSSQSLGAKTDVQGSGLYVTPSGAYLMKSESFEVYAREDGRKHVFTWDREAQTVTILQTRGHFYRGENIIYRYNAGTGAIQVWKDNQEPITVNRQNTQYGSYVAQMQDLTGGIITSAHGGGIITRGNQDDLLRIFGILCETESFHATISQPNTTYGYHYEVTFDAIENTLTVEGNQAGGPHAAFYYFLDIDEKQILLKPDIPPYGGPSPIDSSDEGYNMAIESMQRYINLGLQCIEEGGIVSAGTRADFERALEILEEAKAPAEAETSFHSTISINQAEYNVKLDGEKNILTIYGQYAPGPHAAFYFGLDIGGKKILFDESYPPYIPGPVSAGDEGYNGWIEKMERIVKKALQSIDEGATISGSRADFEQALKILEEAKAPAEAETSFHSTISINQAEYNVKLDGEKNILTIYGQYAPGPHAAFYFGLDIGGKKILFDESYPPYIPGPVSAGDEGYNGWIEKMQEIVNRALQSIGEGAVLSGSRADFERALEILEAAKVQETAGEDTKDQTPPQQKADGKEYSEYWGNTDQLAYKVVWNNDGNELVRYEWSREGLLLVQVDEMKKRTTWHYGAGGEVTGYAVELGYLPFRADGEYIYVHDEYGAGGVLLSRSGPMVDLLNRDAARRGMPGAFDTQQIHDITSNGRTVKTEWIPYPTQGHMGRRGNPTYTILIDQLPKGVHRPARIERVDYHNGSYDEYIYQTEPSYYNDDLLRIDSYDSRGNLVNQIIIGEESESAGAMSEQHRLLANVMQDGVKYSIAQLMGLLAMVTGMKAVSTAASKRSIGDAFDSDMAEGTAFLQEICSDTDNPVLVRVPIEIFEGAGAVREDIVQWVAALSQAPALYIELYSVQNADREVGPTTYDRYGLGALRDRKFPGEMSKRNAVSLFAASKDMKKRELQTALQSSLSLRNSILVPTGLTEDVTGVIRSTLFGLRLVAIARNPKDAEFVKTTIAAYQGIISAYGVQPPDLSVQDILTLATSEDINAVAAALGKIIAALPIRPIPVDELHEIFKRATERLDQSV